MTSRWISLAAAAGIVAGMVGPALAQSTGSSTGSAPATGSGSTMPSSQPAPSATQPSSSAPSTGTTYGKTGAGKAQPGTSMGQSGTTAAGTGSTDTTKASKPAAGMSAGNHSEQVKSAQKALQDKGKDPGPIDGIMGPKTMAALRAFQKDQNLPQTGRLDDQTRDKLGVSL
jgi:murein L,D-transpeptidase YcbB/YkuD